MRGTSSVTRSFRRSSAPTTATRRRAVPSRAAPERRRARREIALANPGRFAGLGARALRAWLAPLLDAIAPGEASLAVRFVGEREMRRFNRDFRGKDRPTDVLSFPGDEGPEGRHLGDVLVCVPVARRQAEARGSDLARETRVLILHGVLHCLGYDHETDGGQMVSLERRLRRRWIDAR